MDEDNNYIGTLPETNSVNTEEIEACAKSLKRTFRKLTNRYQAIEKTLSSYSKALADLKNYDGTFTHEPVIVEETEDKIKKATKIRKITVNSKDDVNVYINGLRKTELEESINMLDLKTEEIEQLATELAFYIKLIQKQLESNENGKIEFDGNLHRFFAQVKKHPDWAEIKEASYEGMQLKLTDEIYLKYHTDSDEDYDYVDFALDHLGLAFVTSSYSSLPATWYSNNALADSGYAKKADNWCAEFVSYAMYNSGNPNKIPSAYIACDVGADQAAAIGTPDSKGNKIGTWHHYTEDYQPQRGDIFYTEGHTGIVVASDEDYIYTIEGNTCRDDGTYYVKNAEGDDYRSNTSGGVVNTRVRPKEYVTKGYYTPDNSDQAVNPQRIDDSKNATFSKEYIDKKTQTQSLFEQHKKDTGHNKPSDN